MVKFLDYPKKTWQKLLMKLDLYLSKKLEDKFLSRQLKFAENSRGWFFTLFFGVKQQLYKGIDDMPILNWYLLNKNKDLSQLYLGIKKDKTKHTLFLKYQWKKINDELVDSLGVSKELKKFYQLQINIKILEINEVLTGENLQTQIKIEKFKLDNLAKANSSDKDYFFPNKIAIEEHLLHGQMDLKKTTIREFNEYINELKRRKK